MKVMSRDGSCDAAHRIQASSPALTSASEGGKVILVESAEHSEVNAMIISKKILHHETSHPNNKNFL